MQYMLLIHANETAFAALPKDQVEQTLGAYTAYTEALKKAGALVDSNRLQPIAAATTVRISNGKTQVLDGPYAEAKEQIGGYYLIEAPDLDAAIAWAARCPGASYGTMEIRPVLAIYSQ
ncbi:YciI family protein [Bradyrhizobium sp. ORS 111]|uniref:YciI family protein n=1 Tax=Bradyrhizobium sp. ORS 111 TaxID=1685958 RepID=UPI0038910B15